MAPSTSKQSECLENTEASELGLQFHFSSYKTESGAMDEHDYWFMDEHDTHWWFLRHLMNLTYCIALRVTILWKKLMQQHFCIAGSVILREIKMRRACTIALYLAVSWQRLANWNVRENIQACPSNYIFPVPS